jgi:hypothetical protein
VFQLTPHAFHEHAVRFYEALGRPLVAYNTFWGIYRQLLHAFVGGVTTSLASVISAIPDTVARINGEALPLLSDMKELRGGDGVIGDGQEVGSSDHVYTDFTDSE